MQSTRRIGKKKEKKNKNKKRRKIIVRKKKKEKGKDIALTQLSNTFTKRKHIAVKLWKKSEICYWLPIWVPIVIELFTLMKDIIPQLNRIKII